MTKDKEKDAVIRRGDYVRLKNPRRFVRCGYDLDHQEIMECIEAERRADLEKVKAIFGCENAGGRADEKLINALAFMIISSQSFGGKERKVFTTPITADLADKKYLVRATYMVRTGEYYSPWSGQSYEGEHDYEPGGLDKAKSHKIVRTDALVEVKTGNYLPILEGIRARRRYKDNDPSCYLSFLAEDLEKIVPGDSEYVSRQNWNGSVDLDYT